MNEKFEKVAVFWRENGGMLAQNPVLTVLL
jgi:hypothetical protein